MINKKILTSIKGTEVISLLAFAVSLFSICFSIYQFRRQNENFEKQFKESHFNDSIQRVLAITNTKNSVRPLVEVFKISTPRTDPILGIQLQNAGFGPAIIDSIKAFFDNKPGDFMNIDSFAKSVNLQCWNRDKFNFKTFVQGVYALKPGGVEWVFFINREDVFDYYNFQQLMSNHVKIVVKYHSLTNDNYIFDVTGHKHDSKYVDN